MRKQSSAIRVAYNMIRELEKEKTKNPHTQIEDVNFWYPWTGLVDGYDLKQF
jgi:hypothetical protein